MFKYSKNKIKQKGKTIPKIVKQNVEKNLNFQVGDISTNVHP